MLSWLSYHSESELPGIFRNGISLGSSDIHPTFFETSSTRSPKYAHEPILLGRRYPKKEKPVPVNQLPSI